MRQILLIFVATIVFNCTSDDSQLTTGSEILGKWKLIEQLADPGDGSGTFQQITSDRLVEFFSNGTVEINGILCFMSNEIGDTETGTYQITSDPRADTTYDGEIIPNMCSSRSAKVYFNLMAESTLILWYQCIEGCGQKFVKIN